MLNAHPLQLRTLVKAKHTPLDLQLYALKFRLQDNAIRVLGFAGSGAIKSCSAEFSGWLLR